MEKAMNEQESEKKIAELEGRIKELQRMLDHAISTLIQEGVENRIREEEYHYGNKNYCPLSRQYSPTAQDILKSMGW